MAALEGHGEPRAGMKGTRNHNPFYHPTPELTTIQVLEEDKLSLQIVEKSSLLFQIKQKDCRLSSPHWSPSPDLLFTRLLAFSA